MYPGAAAPELTDIKSPVATGTDKVLVHVKAVAIKNLDIGKATGKHYSSSKGPEGEVIGTDGVGINPDGIRVYGIGRDGMLAESSLIDPRFITTVPDELDDITAAAIPNAVMGSAMALLFRSGIHKGETVLINGATGVTGRMAIQVARHYGAGKIIVTGRNLDSWPELKALGADQWITLDADQNSFSDTVRQLNNENPIDIVLDYLWGASASAILAALKGRGEFTHPVRYVSIGEMSGDIIELSSSILRGTSIQLTGSGLGSWSKEEVGQLFKEILPEFFQLAAAGKLSIHTQIYGLEAVGEMWNAKLPGGVRAVVQMA